MPETVEGVKPAASNPGANDAATQVKRNNPEGEKGNPGERERQQGGNPVTADGGDWPRRLGWLVFAGLVLAGLAVATQGRS